MNSERHERLDALERRLAAAPLDARFFWTDIAIASVAGMDTTAVESLRRRGVLPRLVRIGNVDVTLGAELHAAVRDLRPPAAGDHRA